MGGNGVMAAAGSGPVPITAAEGWDRLKEASDKTA